MTETYIQYALGVFLGINLCYCIYTDFKSRLIYNYITLPIALAAPIYWYATGDTSFSAIATHLAIGIGTFLFYSIFHKFGWMGGGDVKLFAALAFWFDFVTVAKMLLYAAVCGGLLTVLLLMWHIAFKSKRKLQIPYGVAIAVSALWTVSERIFNHFT
ncbi:hypothetical protein LPB140_09570 [Sphingorhabdus lutea]|uniref:Prepilin type IV endopeptidase peptidase domain-containing protein n=1 Tax=Sphingorhabdus lutea TaxID=1913578 RepID=A0A1L3JCY7_9SPHN|nr:prepilin peptidase [Sphingorhabdus lutea]APG62996.1 hypothetical protein LPB140_09570 [Sphingorhabdus lutea]